MIPIFPLPMPKGCYAINKHLPVDGTFKSTEYIFLGHEKEWGKSAFHELPSLERIPGADRIGSKCQAPYFFTRPDSQSRFRCPSENQRCGQLPGERSCLSHPLPTASKPDMVSLPGCPLTSQSQPSSFKTKATEKVLCFPNNPSSRGLLQIQPRRICVER